MELNCANLSEFERTRSNNSVQTAPNINSFLADYLNPPRSNGVRFSRHNLYELRQNLTPVERDYFFKVVDGARQVAVSGTPTKQLDQQQRQERVKEARANPLQIQKSKNLRDEIEDRVSNYLISVVRTRGVQVLEQRGEGLHHAAMVNNIIKETFKENHLRLETYKLTEERIANVSSKLVGELPQSLRERGKQIGSDETLERKQLPSILERDSRLSRNSSTRGNGADCYAIGSRTTCKSKGE